MTQGNPKDITRKPLELINEFGKVARQKIHSYTEYTQLHFYTLTLKDQEEK